MESHLCAETPRSLPAIRAALALARGCKLPAKRVNAAAAERLVALLDSGEAMKLLDERRRAASDAERFWTAHAAVRDAPPRVVALALGALAASARRGAAARARALPPGVPLRLAAGEIARLGVHAARAPEAVGVRAGRGWHAALWGVPEAPHEVPGQRRLMKFKGS